MSSYYSETFGASLIPYPGLPVWRVPGDYSCLILAPVAEAMVPVARGVPAGRSPGGRDENTGKGKQAVKMTRLSCHRFRSNEVRLWLGLIAYNLGNLWRRLVLPNRTWRRLKQRYRSAEANLQRRYGRDGESTGRTDWEQSRSNPVLISFWPTTER